MDKVNFSVASIGKEEEEAVIRVLRSGWLTTGKETFAFEKEFADKIGVKYTLAVNSATSGLMLAYDACGINEDNKILTTPYTFASTALAARHLGAHIEYADIEDTSYNIDPTKIEEKLASDTKKTIKAIVPVHIAGNVCKMDEIKAIAQKYNVYVIEDAAHAFPSPTPNGYAGTLGDVGVFSFYATKTITTAEGGMVATNNEDISKRMQIMRLHGIDRPVWNRYSSDKASWEYDVIESGWKCNLPDVLSAIGREQLKKADIFFEKRKKIVEMYKKTYSEYDFLQLPPDDCGNAWHLFLIRLNLNHLSITRKEFGNILQNKGISISMHFIPHFHLSYFKKLYNLNPNDFPNAEDNYQRTITLPLWPDMTEEIAQRVIDAVVETGKEHYV